MALITPHNPSPNDLATDSDLALRPSSHRTGILHRSSPSTSMALPYHRGSFRYWDGERKALYRYFDATPSM